MLPEWHEQLRSGDQGFLFRAMVTTDSAEVTGIYALAYLSSCAWVEVILSTRGCMFLLIIAVKCKRWLANLSSHTNTNDDEEFITDRNGSFVVAERATN